MRWQYFNMKNGLGEGGTEANWDIFTQWILHILSQIKHSDKLYSIWQDPATQHTRLHHLLPCLSNTIVQTPTEHNRHKKKRNNDLRAELHHELQALLLSSTEGTILTELLGRRRRRWNLICLPMRNWEQNTSTWPLQPPNLPGHSLCTTIPTQWIYRFTVFPKEMVTTMEAFSRYTSI